MRGHGWNQTYIEHAMQGNRASSRGEGDVSWVFSICGRHGRPLTSAYNTFPGKSHSSLPTAFKSLLKFLPHLLGHHVKISNPQPWLVHQLHASVFSGSLCTQCILYYVDWSSPLKSLTCVSIWKLGIYSLDAYLRRQCSPKSWGPIGNNAVQPLTLTELTN